MAETWLRRVWSAAGVRRRTTAVSVVVVAVVLALGLVLLADQTRARLEDEIAASAETRALDVAALAEADALSGEIVTLTNDQLIQVVAGGTVVAASPGLEGVRPFFDATTAPGTTEELEVAEAVFEAIEEQSPLVEDESPYVVIARGYQSPSGAGVVLVASSLAPAEAAVNALRPILLIGFPVTLAAVAAAVWFLTGRALHPVEAMREEAEAISAIALSRRLPQPHSRDEVGRLAETLNHMLDRLESASVRQRRFVSDASHELKTPLATMRTMLEIAADDPAFSDWRRLVGSLQREEARMAALVTDLLTLARFDEGAVETAHTEVHLDQVLGRVAERTAATRPGLAVDTTGIDAALVRGDPYALETLFTNLGVNAAQHAAGSVTFSCGSSNGRIVAVVSDDGRGIPEDERERVFERFVRLDESRHRNSGGTGLGLAVARAIARAHGGDVTVSGTETGARLEVVLPAGEEPGRFSARS